MKKISQQILNEEIKRLVKKHLSETIENHNQHEGIEEIKKHLKTVEGNAVKALQLITANPDATKLIDDPQRSDEIVEKIYSLLDLSQEIAEFLSSELGDYEGSQSNDFNPAEHEPMQKPNEKEFHLNEDVDSVQLKGDNKKFKRWYLKAERILHNYALNMVNDPVIRKMADTQSINKKMNLGGYSVLIKILSNLG